MTEPLSLFEAIADAYALQRAWAEVRGGRTLAARRQGAGIDGVTVAEWEAGWPERLQSLQSALLVGAYRPSPLLWFDIPRRSSNAKRDGLSDTGGVPPSGRCQVSGAQGTRRLGIPTVADRIIQRAAKNVLEPIWEPAFLSCSHGFRPSRSVFTAVAHVLWHQARGLEWVVDGDIEACFDNLSHNRLLAETAALGDDRVAGLVAGWLQAGAASPGRGVAQGAVISPLLANVYLHPFDVAMIQAGLALVRYADDWVILCASRREAQAALDAAADVLAELELALNPDKTAIVPFGPGFSFLGAEFRP